ncbi:RagB/SusD family nutrient uptake outer membrane protein [Reichenbachiella sp. MALMAid0571]|uniref:RagB/SusD family nutrient uptake outer membrane protein n=1 Tax=Reichenbachiella sp. MALMAid0571 TaxID=3143939 RepID=UPI0032DF85B3
MKNKIILICTLGLLLISMISCDDKLEENVYSELLASNGYTTVEDAESLITSVYSSLKGNDWGTYYEMSLLQISELPTDYGQDTWSGGSDPYEIGTWGNNEQYTNEVWVGAYAVVASANFALSVLEGMNIDDQIRAGYIAEAKFLRALAYYDLTFNFKDVILNLGETTGDLAVSPQADIIAQIIKDLTEAAPDLPGYATNGVGRATKGAALGLRAKTNLNAKNWDTAAADAKAVMDLGEYDLFPSATEIFYASNKTDNEWVFAIHSDGSGAGAETQLSWFTLDGTYQNGGWGNLVVTDEFYKTFDTDDTRRNNMANGYQDGGQNETSPGVFEYHVIPGTPEYTALSTDASVSISDLDYAPITKHTGGQNRFDSDPAKSGVNYAVLRYADILLIRAEALNETNDQDGAMTVLNIVRDRAGLTGLSGLNQVDLRAAILEERAKELFMEGHRRVDLVRSGKHIALWKAGLEGKYPGGNFSNIDESKSYYPIPQSEIDANSQLTPDNN